MPTLDYIEGFGHQVLSTLQFAGAGVGLADNLANPGQLSIVTSNRYATLDPVTPQPYALQVIEDGVTATAWRRDLPTTQQRVVGFYFKLPSGAPSVASNLHVLRDSAGNGMAQFQVTAAGVLQARAGGGAFQSSGVDVSDGTWHRLDYWLDSSGTTWTLRWRLDGTLQTNATEAGHVATNSIRLTMGSSIATDTLSFQISDIVTSAQGNTDYPLGGHHVIYLVPNRALTDSNPANMPITGATTAWQAMDEWPADTSSFVAETAIGTTDYREVGFGNVHGDEVVWDVIANAALFAAGTAACTGTTSIFSAFLGNLGNVYAGDMSETALNYRSLMLARPAQTPTWDAIGVNQLRARVGFSDDATPDPQWSALMLQVAMDGAFPTKLTATPLAGQPRLLGKLAGGRTQGPILMTEQRYDFPPPPGVEFDPSTVPWFGPDPMIEPEY